MRPPGSPHHEQRLAAALVEMATRSASTPADANGRKPLFTVLIGDDSLARLCELANGTVLTPDLLVPHLGVADMETILFDGPLTVIAASGARASRAGCGGRSKSAIGTVSTPPAATSPPASAISTTSSPPSTAGRPASSTGARMPAAQPRRHPPRPRRTPHPERPVTVLDEIRARLRWHHLHGDDGGDDDDSDEPAA